MVYCCNGRLQPILTGEELGKRQGGEEELFHLIPLSHCYNSLPRSWQEAPPLPGPSIYTSAAVSSRSIPSSPFCPPPPLSSLSALAAQPLDPPGLQEAAARREDTATEHPPAPRCDSRRQTRPTRGRHRLFLGSAPDSRSLDPTFHRLHSSALLFTHTLSTQFQRLPALPRSPLLLTRSSNMSTPVAPLRVAIAGGGIAGLCTALALAKRIEEGANIKLDIVRFPFSPSFFLPLPPLCGTAKLIAVYFYSTSKLPLLVRSEPALLSDPTRKKRCA